MQRSNDRLARAACLAALWAAAGCRSVVDPPLPTGAVRLAPPAVYARWWALSEACSGRSRDIGDITWYVVPNAASFPSGGQGEVNGYYSSPGAQIVLAADAEFDGPVVRHEMLHALLRDQPGHARAQFLGACAGTVICADACVRDAGPAPAPPAGAVPVDPKALSVTVAVSPAAPSASQDDGWFTLTVTATNTAAAAVTVPTPGVTFGYDIATMPASGTAVSLVGHDEPLLDASAVQFAAGESKRLVVDLCVGVTRCGTNLPPGRYVFRGSFGGRGPGGASAPLAVTLAP